MYPTPEPKSTYMHSTEAVRFTALGPYYTTVSTGQHRMHAQTTLQGLARVLDTKERSSYSIRTEHLSPNPAGCFQWRAVRLPRHHYFHVIPTDPSLARLQSASYPFHGRKPRPNSYALPAPTPAGTCWLPVPCVRVMGPILHVTGNCGTRSFVQGTKLHFKYIAFRVAVSTSNCFGITSGNTPPSNNTRARTSIVWPQQPRIWKPSQAK